jgi:hypothetical protein
MAPILLALGPIMTSIASAGTAAATALGASGTLGTIGTILGAGATIYGGFKAKEQADAVAAQMKAKGDSEFAVAQRKSLESQERTRMVLGQQKAVAAASGGGATDPSVMAIMGKTQQKGDYNSMIDMYNGAVSRNDMYTAADNTESEGKSKLFSSFLNAGSTIYGDASRRRTMRDTYSLDNLSFDNLGSGGR